MNEPLWAREEEEEEERRGEKRRGEERRKCGEDVDREVIEERQKAEEENMSIDKQVR